MELVIVESPTKAKTLSKFLGSDYRIEASMGHIRDLPENRLGIDVNHDFEPTYLVPADRKKTVTELKELAGKADKVILATDPDREGEAIAWHIGKVLNSSLSLRGAKRRGNLNEEKKIATPLAASSGLAMTNERWCRIVFHEITESAIHEALKNPRAIDLQLVDAQQARRILDRLVGYKLSPLLWSKVRRGLSAGRVQSVALRIVCEREKEREKFKAEEYWTVVLEVKSQGLDVIARSETTKQSQENEIATPLATLGARNDKVGIVNFELISKDGIKYETSQSFELYDGKYTVTKSTILTKEQTELIINDIKNYNIYIFDIEKKAIKRYPGPPFTTSTLQQEAGRRLGFSAKRTMQIAQRLYEEGLITYHRTDSVNLSAEAVNKCRSFVAREFGQEYVPETPRFFKTKQKLAQEAHEAIRPTKVEVRDGKLEMGRDEERVYNLIWKRFVACQMKEAEMEGTTVFARTASNASDLSSLGNLGYLFKATGSVITFPGFLKVYPEALEENKLPTFNEGEELQRENLNPVQHFTQPPPRYSEATLVQTLEEKGIGRPSTYAPIISTIKDRHYVEVEEKRLVPTALGVAVNDFLVKNFSEIDDMPFTAQMEDQFDQIADGQKQWVPVIKDFFTPFSDQLQSVYKTSERVKIEVQETNEKCDVCGSPLVVRIGRFGKFLACSRFPDCKFTKPLKISTGLKCPEDGGDVIIRRTKKGKTFYGCSNYPKCKWASWTKPKPQQ